MNADNKLKEALDELTLTIHHRNSKKGLDVYGHGSLDYILNAPYVKYEYKVENGKHVLILNPYSTKTPFTTTAKSPKSNPKGWINHIIPEIANPMIADGFTEGHYHKFDVLDVDSSFGTFRSVIVDLDAPVDLKEPEAPKPIKDDDRLSRIEKKLDEVINYLNVLKGWVNVYEQSNSEQG